MSWDYGDRDDENIAPGCNPYVKRSESDKRMEQERQDEYYRYKKEISEKLRKGQITIKDIKNYF